MYCPRPRPDAGTAPRSHRDSDSDGTVHPNSFRRHTSCSLARPAVNTGGHIT